MASPAEEIDKNAYRTPVISVMTRLWEYCQARNWAGCDPYDGLNSKIFQRCRFLHSRYPRLALTQALKRSPLDFRRLLRVPKEQNPKGIALFLTSAVRLAKLRLLPDADAVQTLYARLLALKSAAGHTGWGYNFDWQTRKVMVPRGTPNIICTTFAGNALLDAFSLDPNPALLASATEASHFIMERLYFETAGSEACFAYYPLGRTMIHNANLLGAAFLSRVSRETGNTLLLAPALKAARFSVRKQHADGSWDYGESDQPSQRWIDNFHTGYNLCALRRIGLEAGTSEFEPSIRRGFDFYRRNFFSDEGAPKYYHNRLYPIDIHSSAQSIITLTTLQDLNRDNLRLANQVFSWTVANMWSKRGYFYFQKHRFWTTRIPYMRWGQAWMLLALAVLLQSTTNTAHLR